MPFFPCQSTGYSRINAALIDVQQTASRIHKAAYFGYVSEVKSLLESSVATVDEKNDNGDTPLHLAALEGHTEVVEILLLSYGSVVDAENKDGATPLHLAAYDGRKDVVKMLLDNGAAVDKKKHHGETALHLAAFEGHTEVVEFLLSKSVMVNVRNKNNVTPLSLSSVRGRKEVVQILLDKGADVTGKDSKREKTALHAAASNGHLEIVKILLQAGAAIDASNKEKRTPLHLAAMKGQLGVVKILSSNSINNNVKDVEHHTPLHLAVMEAIRGTHTKVIDELLQNKANIDEKNTNGETPLHVAAIRGNAEVVEHLLKYGATLNIWNNGGDTPFHIASIRGDTEIVRLMLIDYDKKQNEIKLRVPLRSSFILHVDLKKKSKTAVNLKNETGDTALTVAIQYGRIEIVEMLLKYGGDVTSANYGRYHSLHTAASIEQFCVCAKQEHLPGSKIYGILEKHVYNKTCQRKDHDTYMERIKIIIQLLLENGADVDQRNEADETPLMIASKLGFTLFVKMLFKYGDPEPNLKDKNGETALIKAVENRKVKIVELLLTEGVDVNLHDNRGFTALHAALDEETRFYDLRILCHITEEEWREKNRETKDALVQLLLSSGADASLTDFRGNIPLELAYRFQKTFTDDVTIKTLRQHSNISSANFGRNRCNARGRTFLHWFIIRGVSIRSPSVPYNNVIILSPFHTTKDFVRFIYAPLLQVFKTDYDSQDHRGRTPLHYLFMQQNLEFDQEREYTMKCLLDNLNTSLNVHDLYEKTPLHYAIENKSIPENVYHNLMNLNGDGTDERDCDKEMGNKLLDLRKEWNEKQSKFKEIDKILIKLSERTDMREKFERILETKNVYDNIDTLSIGLSSSVELQEENPDYVNSIAWKCWKESQFAYRHQISDCLCEKVEQFIERLAVEIGKRDGRFKCKPKFVGSSREGTRINLPDEYDFHVVLTNFSKICDAVPSPDAPKGFVHVKRKSNIIYERDSSYFNAEGFLLTSEVGSRFQFIVCDVFKDRDFWENEPVFDWEMQNETEFDYGKHVRSLCMTVKLRINKPINDIYMFGNISIDFVPCIHIDGWWPEGALSKILNEETKSTGCNLVFERPQRKYPFVPYTQPFAMISCAPAERQIIADAPPVARAAYMVGKHLFETQRTDFTLGMVSYVPKRKSMVTSQPSADKTYILKTCLFYCIEALKEREEAKRASDYEEITPKELCLWVEKLFRCYLEFCLHDRVPCYLVPDFILPFQRVFKLRAKEHNDMDGDDAYYLECLNTFGLHLSTSLNTTERLEAIKFPVHDNLDRERVVKILQTVN